MTQARWICIISKRTLKNFFHFDLWEFVNLSSQQSVSSSSSSLALVNNLQWYLQHFTLNAHNYITLLYNYSNFPQLRQVKQKPFDDVVFSCPACSINYLQEMFAEICKSLTSWGHLSHARFHQFHQLQLHQTSSSRVHSASFRFGLPPSLSFAFLLSFSILIALHGSVSEIETDQGGCRG